MRCSSMLIAHISDSHISIGGPTDDDRLATLQACVDDINRLTPQPEAVVHTGDIVQNGTNEEYGRAASILKQLDAPLLVVPGNKDNRAGMRAALADSCGPTGCAPFIQFAHDFNNVRLILLDSKSQASNKGALCEGRLAHAARMLEECDKCAVVFMHHPPFEVPSAPDPFQFESRAQAGKLLDLCRGCAQPVTLITGHIHRPYSARLDRLCVHTSTALAIDLRKGQDMGDWANDPVYMLYSVAGDGTVASALRRVPWTKTKKAHCYAAPRPKGRAHIA